MRSTTVTALSIERYSLPAMIREVLDLKDDFDRHARPMSFLLKHWGRPLVTADAKLAEARKLGVDVRVLRPNP